MVAMAMYEYNLTLIPSSDGLKALVCTKTSKKLSDLPKIVLNPYDKVSPANFFKTDIQGFSCFQSYINFVAD